MGREDERMLLSRRKFLKIAAGVSAATASTFLGGGAFIHDRMVESDLEKRAEPQPLLKKTPIPSQSVVFGGYFDPMEGSMEERVHTLSGITTLFADWTRDDWGSARCKQLNQDNRVPMLTVGVKSDVPGGKITSDNFERQLARVSSVVEKLRGTYGIWRFNHESNGYYYPHSNKYLPDELIISIYRKMADVFREHTPDWKLVYAPNVFFTEEMDLLYPGDDVVDIFGLSAFRKYSSNLLSLRRWQHPPFTAHELLAPDVLHIQTRYPQKPLMVCEVGADAENKNGTDRFFRELMSLVPTWKNMNSVCLFCADKREFGNDEYEANWNIFSKPTGEKVLSTLETNPVYYKGKLTPSQVLEKITAMPNT